MVPFKKSFESSVINTIKRYSLASKNERIIVACSGGKDSTTVLNILHANHYNVQALHMDLGMGKWSKQNKKNIASFCKERGIVLHLTSAREYMGSSVCYIKGKVQAKKKLTPCAICGVLKKWILNRKSRELKADKVATGHNLDDESRTFMMNIFNGNPELCFDSGPMKEMGEGLLVPRIKPLYLTSVKDIERYSMENNFPVVYERCPCSADSFGRGIYNEITALERYLPDIKENIVKTSLEMQSKKKKQAGVIRCRLCGEPSRKGICRTCSMISSNLPKN